MENMDKIKINWKISMLLFWASYVLVTLVGIGHTCFNWLVLKMENAPNRPIKTMYDIVAYAATVPYHVLYNIIIWPLFAVLFFRTVRLEKGLWKTAFYLGLSWSIITVVFDVFAWVIIRHPWSMTWSEMYLDYQPWITLIYLSILISPFIGALLYKKTKK
jgi:hypothetical protein